MQHSKRDGNCYRKSGFFEGQKFPAYYPTWSFFLALPPNTAPQSPPSYLVPPNDPVADRHIFQPVPPSKRAPTDTLPQTSEAAPTPPPVPTHSRSSKGSKGNKTNFSNKSAVVAVPQVALAPVRAGKQTQTSVSNIPSKPVATESSWATVVRHGHKKVRAATAETSSAGQNKPNEQQKLSTPKKFLHQLF
ncbi:hypothetical protein K3495_g3566 [Podosphaera aphanis]|nr:hypothetical protein K3495_g3566 [Podosphaera aphanis]